MRMLLSLAILIFCHVLLGKLTDLDALSASIDVSRCQTQACGAGNHHTELFGNALTSRSVSGLVIVFSGIFETGF